MLFGAQTNGTPQVLHWKGMDCLYLRAITLYFRACSGSTYIKIGTIQRRLAWPLRKDDTQIREAFQILLHKQSGRTFYLALSSPCHGSKAIRGKEVFQK